MRRRTTTGIVIAGVAAVAGLTVLAFSGKWGGSADADITGYWVPNESYETAPYLDVQKDGSFTSSDGCNTVSGTWSLDGEALSVEAGPSTLMACDGAPVPTYFATAATARVVDGALELRDDAGKVLIALITGTPGTAPETTEPTADTGAAESYIGEWSGPAAGGAAPTLNLAADGTLTGNDGCNTLRGTWELADGTVVFGPMMSTRMACEGVDPWLGNVATGTLEGDSLGFHGVEGEFLGELSRS